MGGLTVASYSTRFGIDLDGDAKSKSYQTISREVLPRHLGNVERLLESSATGWIAGTKEPSPADFVWYGRLADYIPSKRELTEKVRTLRDYPGCREFVKKFGSLEAVKEYYDAEGAPESGCS